MSSSSRSEAAICQDGTSAPQPKEIRTGSAFALATTFEAEQVSDSDTKYHPTTSIYANQPAKMSDSQVTLRTRKFIRNPLLGRKQMVVCVQTPPPRRE